MDAGGLECYWWVWDAETRKNVLVEGDAGELFNEVRRFAREARLDFASSVYLYRYQEKSRT